MSIIREHGEWLSLTETSGPFLSIKTLKGVFPQGLDTLPDSRSDLRELGRDWMRERSNGTADTKIQWLWVKFVLSGFLGYPDKVVKEGEKLPKGYTVENKEYGVHLKPDLALMDLTDKRLRMPVFIFAPGQDLKKKMKTGGWRATPAEITAFYLRAQPDTKVALAVNGDEWMLVSSNKDMPTGYASFYTSVWLDEDISLRAFYSLLKTGRFFGVDEKETLEALFERSRDQQDEVTTQLGAQVRRSVEILVQRLDRINRERDGKLLVNVSGEPLSEERLYEAVLVFMMRLVFMLSAEEQGLILKDHALYEQHYAVGTLGAQIRKDAAQLGEEFLENRFDAWARLLATFRLIYGGMSHPELKLPPHGGSLFDPNRFPFLEGRGGDQDSDAIVQPLPVDNRTVLHLLESLQILEMKTPGGKEVEARRLSFRELDVEQIGHVYEGLLDHEVRRAEDVVLGLAGTRGKEPEIPLKELEALKKKGAVELITFLKKQTGRSEKALQKALDEGFSGEKRRLDVVCEGNAKVLKRIQQFAGLLRNDDFEYPLVVPMDGLYVTEGPSRRATGSHYTPRHLTEEVVEHALTPLLFEGVVEGAPREKWKLKGSKEILELKVCDMAMGSGAFLVQACRFLADRLLEAWDGEERSGAILVPDGLDDTGLPRMKPLPNDEEQRRIFARRYVAERCIYGVDLNPLAVEMARMSLWLTTLSQGRPFTFLEHALKCGDSLLGAGRADFQRWAGDSFYHGFVKEQLHTAVELREELESFDVANIADRRAKAEKQAAFEETVEEILHGCDFLAGSYLAEIPSGERDALMRQALKEYTSGKKIQDERAIHVLQEARGRRQAFHWNFEFPEVFARGGFDAIIGNPPFMGGQKITGNLGEAYREYLVRELANGVRGSADLCTYFLLNALRLLRNGGTIGLITTNTIAQGDTRDVGLESILNGNNSIYRAISSTKWPGSANIEISKIWIIKGNNAGIRVLNGKDVKRITSNLRKAGSVIGKPYQLVANENKVYQGLIILGDGFLLTPEEAQNLLGINPKNKDVLFPYLNGKNVNSRYDQSPSRWVINFFDWPEKRIDKNIWVKSNEKDKKEWKRKGFVAFDYPGPVAEDYPECFEIIKAKVKPERELKNRKVYREYWWQYAEKRPALYKALKKVKKIMIHLRVSDVHSFVFTSKDNVIANTLYAILLEPWQYFSILQSSLHEEWVRSYSSTMRKDINYSPTDCFETFPFPLIKQDEPDKILEDLGARYYEYRQSIMQKRKEGITNTYNRFHNPEVNSEDIVRLRELHVEIDHAVRDVYGWQDLELNHGFRETRQGARYTADENAREEILERLLVLNHERYAKEVEDGLHAKKNVKKKTAPQKKTETKEKDQPDLFT